MTIEPHKRRPAWFRAAFRVLAVGLVFAGWFLFFYAGSPLTPAWDPRRPLNVQDDLTPLTQWKLSRALADGKSCRAALATSTVALSRDDLLESEQCSIRDQVSVSQMGRMAVIPALNTRCQTALRMAMWEHHGLQPAAAEHFGNGVRRISHFSSYSCRAIRTTQGGTQRMSTHATAEAVDISGFVLRSGQQVTLLKHWNGTPAEQAFLREVRDSACTWFRVTLGPEYNALHADHFHLQHTGWGLCR